MKSNLESVHLHDHRLYRRLSSKWVFYSRILTSRTFRYPRFHLHPTSGHLPNNTVNCTVLLRGDCLLLTGHSARLPAPPVAPTHRNIFTFLANQPPSAQWALHSVTLDGNFPSLLQSLEVGGAIAVSDGSFGNASGTASWIITNQIDSVSGLCILPGLDRFHSSYRSELGGLYAILQVVWAIEQVHPNVTVTLDIHCDSLSAGRQSFRPLQWPRCAGV